MNTMIALHRSTALADVRARRGQSRKPAASHETVVRTGGISLGSRTMIGNATHTINRAYSRVGVRVGAQMPALGSPVTATGPAGTVSYAAPGPVKEGGIVGAIGKTAGWALLASMVAGPPAVGYLIGGKIGLAVGAVVAAPMVVLFTVSLIGSMKEPTYA